MTNNYYEQIFDDFKMDHPYLVNDVDTYRPRGDRGIRVTTRDGKQYDYDTITRGVRRVVNFEAEEVSDITDEHCRSAFAYHLTELMSLKGYTQQELAERAGLSKGAVNSYINKKATPSATALRRIAKLFSCTIDELLM